MFATTLVIKYRRQQRKETLLVQEIVRLILRKLVEQEQEHLSRPSVITCPSISVTQLRDSFDSLIQEIATGNGDDNDSTRYSYIIGEKFMGIGVGTGQMGQKDRLRIWARVQTEIKRNSNVRESVTVIKGEQHRVWKWIGSPLLSPLRKKIMHNPTVTANESNTNTNGKNDGGVDQVTGKGRFIA